MTEFQVGDRVERIAGSFGNMHIGDQDVIVDIRRRIIDLKHFGQGHSCFSLRRISDGENNALCDIHKL